MKTFAITSTRLATFTLALIFGAVGIARGQGAVINASGRVAFDELDRLASRAAETVNVSLDENLLRIVPKALSKTDPDEVKAREIIAGLKGVYVKSFEFDTEGAYTAADIDQVRQQLRAPGWSRIVEVRSRQGKNVEVYLMTNGSRIDGLTVLALEPKELTVVNIVGTIDLEKLSELEGKLGVPVLEIEIHGKSPKKK